MLSESLNPQQFPSSVNWLLTNPEQVTLRDGSAMYVGAPTVEYQSRRGRNGKIDWANPNNRAVRDALIEFVAAVQVEEGFGIGSRGQGIYRNKHNGETFDLAEIFPDTRGEIRNRKYLNTRDSDVYRKTIKRTPDPWVDYARKPLQGARSLAMINLNENGLPHRGQDPRVMQDSRFAVDSDGQIHGVLTRVLVSPFDKDGNLEDYGITEKSDPFETALHFLIEVLRNPGDNEVMKHLVQSGYLNEDTLQQLAEIVFSETDGKPWAVNVGIEVKEEDRRKGIATALNSDAPEYVYVGASKRAFIEQLRSGYGHQTVAFGLPKDLSQEQRAVVATGFAMYNTWLRSLTGSEGLPSEYDMSNKGLIPLVNAEDEEVGSTVAISEQASKVTAWIKGFEEEYGLNLTPDGQAPLFFGSIVSY